MKTFNDNDGRQWQVPINVATIKRVRNLTGTDLMEIVGGELIDRLAADPVLLVDVLYAVCGLQAEKLGVSDEQFGQAMGGDALDNATDALLEGLVDFFPNAKRAVLSKLLTKVREAQTTVLDLASKEIDQLDAAELVRSVIKQETGRDASGE